MLMKENALCRMSIRKSHKSWGVDYSSYGMTGVKSPYHKFALSFRLSGEQKAQGSDNDSYGFPVSLSSVKQM